MNTNQRPNVPSIVIDIVDELKQLSFIHSVVLFGSRARGDADSRSDIDLAVDCPSASNTEWADILNTVNTSKTLLKIDCLRLDQATPELKQAIQKEGIILYNAYQ